MRTEVIIALRNLEVQIPVFYKQEMFSHADLKTLESAKNIMREGLKPTGAAKTLRKMLELV